MTREEYMGAALDLARKAAITGEVPVGCVIVNAGGQIIGRGRNRREEKKCASAHAEMIAIEEACLITNDWRLSDCTLFVTLEPCPMCAGAILNARIGAVYYGAKDQNTGSCGSVINLFMENYGFSPKVVGGILSEECSAVLADFFRGLRQNGQ